MVAKTERIKNRTVITIDGKPVSPLIYTFYYHKTETKWNKEVGESIRNFHKAGIDLLSVLTELSEDWKADGTYTAESILRVLKKIKCENKECKVLLRLRLTPPYWWMRKNPNELFKYYGVLSSDTEGMYPELNKDKTNEIRASFVSEKWIKESSDVIGKLCEILKNSEYKDNILGIQPGYGTCSEWHIYGKYYDEGSGIFEGDYSEPMLKFFRRYLKKKYVTAENLSAAWGENVDFETAKLATPNMRKAYSENQTILLPEHSMRALDTLKCLQLGAPYAISAFAAAIKSNWEDILVGTFYGYFFSCGNVFGRMLESEEMYHDKNIDFFAAPCPYTANKKSGNVAFLRYLAESVRLNGKLFICEMDQGPDSYSYYRDLPTNSYVCENDEEYCAIIKRNIFENIIRGHGAWYFDHKHPKHKDSEKEGYFITDKRMNTIKEIQRVCTEMTARNKAFEKTADVLIVYSTESVYYMGLTDEHNTYFQFDMADAVAKSGVGYDYIDIKDIFKCEIDKYRCILFTDCEFMTEEEYKYIAETVMGGGRTIVFMGKNGYIVGDKTSVDNMKKLFRTDNLKDASVKVESDYKIVITPQKQYKPKYYRELFSSAGAHIYTDNGEVVCADNNLIMVHCINNEKSVIHLFNKDITVRNEKYETSVYDAESGKKII